MNGYLIDTHIFIDFFKKREEARRLIVDLAEKGKPSASILSVTELRAGWSEKEAKFFLPRFYKLFFIEPLTLKIAESAGKLMFDYKRKGVQLGTVDTLIAGTAIEKGLVLITRDRVLRSIAELKVYDF